MNRIFVIFLIFLLTLHIPGYSQRKIKSPSEYNLKAISCSRRGLYDSSLYYYNKAARLYDDLQDTLNAGACRINMAKTYRDLGRYEKSLEALLETNRLLEACCKSDPRRIPYLTSSYTTIASVHRMIGNYKKAEEYYHLILGHLGSMPDQTAIAIKSRTYNNLGNLYLSQDANLKARKYFEQTMALHKRLKNNYKLAIALHNLGMVNINLHNYAEATDQLKTTLEIREEVGTERQVASTLNQLGHVSILTRDYVNAAAYLNRSKKIIEEVGILVEMVENCKYFIQLFKATGQTAHLIKAYDRYIILNDSLLNQEKTESLAEMQIKYESEKKQRQISMLTHEKQLQKAALQLKKYWITSLMAGLFLVLVIVVLVYHRFRREKTSKRKIETLMQELQHRIKNNLQTLSSLLSLQTRNISDEKAIAAIKSGESRINAMAVIHQQLNTTQKFTELNIRDYMQNITEYLKQTYGFDGKRIIDQNIPRIYLDVDTVIPLGLIINELISNAFKYAFPNHPDPRLNIDMVIEENILQVCVKDNGPGLMDVGMPSRKGALGKLIISTLTKQLRGSINYRNEAGLEVILRIPTNKK